MSFADSQWIWKNGQFVPWEEATVHVSVHGLHYGSGVFEGIRCYETERGAAIFRLDAHLNRLYRSAAVYGMKIPYAETELAEAIFDLVRRNDFWSCYIRPLCLYGSDNLSLNPSRCPVEVAILAWPWDPLMGREAQEKGVRITVSRHVKFDSRMIPTSAKACGQYLNSILALQEATAKGFDEALLLDLQGHIAEGSGENLFVVQDGEVVTNSEEDAILPGITRESVIVLARELGHAVKVRRLELQDLLTAEEAFFTGTAAEVTPIREVDGRVVGKGRRGPVTETIQRAFFGMISGVDRKDRGWLQVVKPSVSYATQGA